MHCQSCGTEAREGIKFCENCGKSLPLKPADVTTPGDESSQTDPEPPPLESECSSCGATNRPGIAYCEQCGTSLTEPDEAQASATDSSAASAWACGHVNRPGISFCEHCGAPSSDAGTPTPTIKPDRVGGEPRRWATAAAAILLVGVGATLGVLWLGGGGDDVALPPGGSSPSGSPPSLEAEDLITAITDTPLGQDSSIDPNLGMSITDDEGVTYVYNGTSWISITPNGDVWVLPTSTVVVEERSGTLTVGSTDGSSDLAWAESLLDETPGLVRDGSVWIIEDRSAYVDGLIVTADSNGIAVGDSISGSITLVEQERSGFILIDAAENHAWVSDDTAAILVLPTGGGLEVAGTLIPDGSGRAWWHPADIGADILDVAGQILLGFEGVTGSVGEWSVPVSDPSPSFGAPTGLNYKVFVEYEYEDPASRFEGMNVIILDGSDRKERKCPWYKPSCILEDLVELGEDTVELGGSLVSASGDKLESGWNGVTGLTEAGLAATGDLLVCTVTCTIDLAKASWSKLKGLFDEYQCRSPDGSPGGSPGPGPGPSGTGTPAYPAAGYGTSTLAGLGVGAADDGAADLLRLARTWMPLLELSKDEPCGEILRIFAEAFPYTPDGKLTDILDEANRVELVYTVFYAEDGGRFKIEHHLGDNEGFAIGLARSNRTDGRCSGIAGNWEFVGGRSVGHKDAEGLLQKVLKFTQRTIDDFGPGDVGTPCPNPGDPSYRLLVAESKHAGYYDRDFCEDVLAPNLTLLMTTLATGGLFGGTIAFLGLDALLDMAPADIRHDLQGGLEECESGRRPFDLSDRVELMDWRLPTSAWDRLGFADTYPSKEGPVRYGDMKRGKACAQRDRPDCGGHDYHVERFFESQAVDPPGAALVLVPDVYAATVDQARAAIETLGLIYFYGGEISLPASESGLDGLAYDQFPDEGTPAEVGDTVTVYLGRDDTPTTVEAPDVGGMTLADAAATIESRGLVIQVAGTIPTTDSSFFDRVMDQDPLYEDVPVGSIVQIWLGSEQAPPPSADTSAPLINVLAPTATDIREEGVGGSVEVGNICPNNPAVNFFPQTFVISASVQDPSGVASVMLNVNLRPSMSKPMNHLGGPGWSVEMGPYPQSFMFSGSQTLGMSMTATDGAGNSVTVSAGSFTIWDCAN